MMAPKRMALALSPSSSAKLKSAGIPLFHQPGTRFSRIPAQWTRNPRPLHSSQSHPNKTDACPNTGLPLLLSPHASPVGSGVPLRRGNLLSNPPLRPLFPPRLPPHLAMTTTSTTTATHASPGPSPPSASSKTVRVVVKGRVQGVFYRNWTIENANQLGLKGWVRNRRDGSVEALFSGDAGKVQEMEQRCRRGPPDAVVTGFQVFPSDDDPGTQFERRATV